MSAELATAKFLIADGQTVSSNAQDFRGYYLVGFYIPSGFEGTALTFQAAPTINGTYLAVYEDANNAVSLTVAQSRYVALGSSAAARAAESLPCVKVVAGTAQTGDITITAFLSPRAR